MFGLIDQTMAYELGVAASAPSQSTVSQSWNWAIRGSSIRFTWMQNLRMLSNPDKLPLIILEDKCLSQIERSKLESWIRKGGILIINGIACKSAIDSHRIEKWRSKIAGLELKADDKGLAGVYPHIVSDSAILAPFRVGDGIRIEDPASKYHALLKSVKATVLARGLRIEPGSDEWIRESNAVMISTRELGMGKIVYLNFSLANITTCGALSNNQTPTDCRWAGTARALMRFLLANSLWEFKGYQIPMFRETPGSKAVGVVLTGDVHADNDAYQVRSARLLASELASLQTPLTYYFVGEVAILSPDHYQRIKNIPGVTIGSHSAEGDRYEPKSLSGMSAILEDIKLAERRLEIFQNNSGATIKHAIRTHGWASNQSTSKAWTALLESDVSLVLDHNADAILSGTSGFTPRQWLAHPVNKRFFVPMFEKAIHTEADDFLLSEEHSGAIFSLGSPEPDPCCNWAATFSLYADYIRRWHAAMLQVGSLLGVTEVWLWHPSTPVWKGGIYELRAILNEISKDQSVDFYTADEIATWAYNRELVSAQPNWTSAGKLSSMQIEVNHDQIAAFPLNSRMASRSVGYWVLGDVGLDGWNVTQHRDSFGRLVSVMTRLLEKSDTSK